MAVDQPPAPKRFPPTIAKRTSLDDQARGDLFSIADYLEFLKVQLAWLPTRQKLTRAALGVIFCCAALVILWFEVWPPISAPLRYSELVQ